jgi:hypothetical protein
MRQLTASQKIAVLENRVAHLEKQAMLSFIKDKIESLLKGLRPVSVASKAIKRSGLKHRDLEKALKTAPKTRVHKELMKQLQGKSDEQKIYILAEILEKGEVQGKRAVSMKSLSPYSTEKADILLTIGSALAGILSLFLLRKIKEYLKKLKVQATKESGSKKFFTNFLRGVLTFLYYPLKGIRIISALLMNVFTFIPRLIMDKGMGLKVPSIPLFD